MYELDINVAEKKSEFVDMQRLNYGKRLIYF